MLLEMDPAALQQLLSDHTLLLVAVQKAQAALEKWILVKQKREFYTQYNLVIN